MRSKICQVHWSREERGDAQRLGMDGDGEEILVQGEKLSETICANFWDLLSSVVITVKTYLMPNSQSVFILHLPCHGAHVKTRELWELVPSFYLVLEVELRSSSLTAIAFTYWAILLVPSSELLRINQNYLQLKWQLNLKGGWFLNIIFLIICEFHTVYFDCIYLPNASQIHYQLSTRPTLCLFILKIHWVQCATPKLLYIQPPSGAWLTEQGPYP